MTKNSMFLLVLLTFSMSTQGMNSTIQQEKQHAVQHVEQAEAILTDAQSLTDTARFHLDDVQVLINRLKVQERKMIARTDIAIVVTMVALIVLCATIIERMHWKRNKASKEQDESDEEEVPSWAPSETLDPKNS